MGVEHVHPYHWKGVAMLNLVCWRVSAHFQNYLANRLTANGLFIRGVECDQTFKSGVVSCPVFYTVDKVKEGELSSIHPGRIKVLASEFACKTYQSILLPPPGPSGFSSKKLILTE